MDNQHVPSRDEVFRNDNRSTTLYIVRVTEGMKCHHSNAWRIDRFFRIVVTNWRIVKPRVAGEAKFNWNVMEYFYEKYDISLPFDTLLIYDENGGTDPLHLINIGYETPQRRGLSYEAGMHYLIASKFLNLHGIDMNGDWKINYQSGIDLLSPVELSASWRGLPEVNGTNIGKITPDDWEFDYRK